jgi:hypothetical protein
MLKLAWWGFNLWAMVQGAKAIKENKELKQENNDYKATVRTLAKIDPNLVTSVPPPLPEDTGCGPSL